MLSQADATLVQRDLQLPGLRILLDCDAFAETLQALCPEAGVTAVRSQYLRYKPATSCLVGFRVTASAGQLDVYAQAHNPRLNHKIKKAASRLSVPGPLGAGIMVLPESVIAIYVHPNDCELRAMGRLTDPKGRWRLIKHVLPHHPHLWDGQLTRLRYKPERRYVARLRTSGDDGAVLKFYDQGDFSAAGNNAAAFVSRGPLRVAQRLRRSHRHRVAALEWLEGRPLLDALSQSQVSQETWRTAGAALACVHAQKPELGTSWTPQSYAAALADAAAAAAELVPTIADRAKRLAQRLGDSLADMPWVSEAIHGDFSADQVLIQDGVVAILDFDSAGYGDPRIDLGNFAAKLEYDVIIGGLSGDRARSAFDELLEEYRLASNTPKTGHLGLFTAAGLLRPVAEPFRHRHPQWPEMIELIITRAEELIGGGQARH